MDETPRQSAPGRSFRSVNLVDEVITHSLSLIHI